MSPRARPVELRGLTKFYGALRGVEDVTLSVEEGEILGFLGPNGSGKTTTIRLLLGLLHPDRGTVRLFGCDPRSDHEKTLSRVGFLPANVDWWPDLTGAEILEYFAAFRPDRLTAGRDELCRRFRLSGPVLARRVRTYSRGMRRLLGLAVAFQHDPDLLVLDEPTTGLDPFMRRAFFDRCRAARARGATLFFSSHNLHETQQLCDRVAVIREGRIAAVESLSSLETKVGRTVELVFHDAEACRKFTLPGASRPEREGRRLRFRYRGRWERLLDALRETPVASLSILPPSLDELFLDTFRSPADTASGRGGA